MHNYAVRSPFVQPVKERVAGVPRRVVDDDDAGFAVTGVLERIARREAVERLSGLVGIYLRLGGVEKGLLAP